MRPERKTKDEQDKINNKGGTKYGNVKSSEKDYLKYFKANESVTEGNLMKDLKKMKSRFLLQQILHREGLMLKILHMFLTMTCHVLQKTTYIE